MILSVSTYSPGRIIRIIKSITIREVSKRVPEVPKQLWSGEFWANGKFSSTVGQHGTEKSLENMRKTKHGKRLQWAASKTHSIGTFF